MRLAIADPPYLGRAVALYGNGRPASFMVKHRGEKAHTTDHHQAAQWDDPDTHRRLVADLVARFDGWAIAMAADNLRQYLGWVPADTRIAIWNKPNGYPTASRVIPTYEVVLVWIPPARRVSSTPGLVLRDVLTANKVTTDVIGSKPRAWTRWVLDMLGYQDGDEVVDLFPGSGAVTAEIAQGVLPI